MWLYVLQHIHVEEVLVARYEGIKLMLKIQTDRQTDRPPLFKHRGNKSSLRGRAYILNLRTEYMQNEVQNQLLGVKLLKKL